MAVTRLPESLYVAVCPMKTCNWRMDPVAHAADEAVRAHISSHTQADLAAFVAESVTKSVITEYRQHPE